MSRSADERRRATLRRIVTCAQGLCFVRGFTGFTLDELAEAAGVSRRTLFNYVPDKEHAVLGPAPVLEADDPDIAAFRAGGPSGDLLPDLTWLLETYVQHEPGLAENLDRVGRLLKAHPSLLPRFMSHMEDAVQQLRGIVLARPGETPERAGVAIGLLLALLHLAAQDSVETGTPLPVAVRRARAAFTSLTSTHTPHQP